MDKSIVTQAGSFDTLEYLIEYYNLDDTNDYHLLSKLRALDGSEIDLLKMILVAENIKPHQIREKVGDIKSAQLKALCCWQSYRSIATKLTSIDTLKELDPLKIDLITSFEGSILLYRQLASLKELKNLDLEILKLLISFEARQLYSKEIACFSQLKNLSAEQIKVLTSFEARELYSLKLASPQELQAAPRKLIAALLSFEAREIYKAGVIDLGSLSKLVEGSGNAEHLLKKLLSFEARELYKHHALSPNALAKIEPNKLDLVLSHNVRTMLHKNITSFAAVADEGLGFDQLKALSSFEAMELYDANAATFEDLRSVGKEQLNAMFNWASLEVLLQGKLDFSCSKEMPMESWNVITSAMDDYDLAQRQTTGTTIDCWRDNKTAIDYSMSSCWQPVVAEPAATIYYFG